jgi:phosphoserine phosphatase RsbU/P
MKNPFKGMSSRSIRVVFTISALLVLGVSTINFMRQMVYNVPGNDQCAWRVIPEDSTRFLITDVVRGGVSDKAQIKDGDILLKINGKGFKTNEAQAIINAIKPGDYATYLIERNGKQFETQVEILKTFNFGYFAQFLLGLGFLIVGYVVVMTKPQGYIQRMFGRYSILSMLFFAFTSLNLDSQTSPRWLNIVLLGSFTVSRVFAPPLSISFFFNFPVQKKVPRKKLLLWSIYVLNVAILVILYFANRLGLSIEITLMLFFAGYLFYISGLFVFAHSYFTKVERSRRKELRHILLSVAVVVATLTYIIVLTTTNPFALFLNPILFLPAILMIGYPLAFGYSIFRYRLMDIDLIVKRSLIYGSVTATIAAIYLLIVYGIGNLIAYFLGTEDNRTLNLLALVLIAFAFDPLKRRIQDWVDRFFYQERYNYQKALMDFSRELPRHINLEQILNSMVNRISGTMHVEKVAVVLCDEQEGCGCISSNIPKEYCKFIEGHHGLISLLKETKTPQSFALLTEERDSIILDASDKDKILKSGVVLAVPMFLQDRLIGTINVGPKLSGKVYSQEDIDLLSTVANQAAIAIENARLHQSEIEKQRIEEELKLAWKIQQGLLPKSNPAIDGLDITGITIPARVVGGDYFDYIQLGAKKILIVVADVSGKGMSAALYMSKIQGMIQLASHMYASPKEILIEVNRRIYDGIERKSFITMILALFDLERKQVSICRAGHNKAIISTNGKIEHLNAGGIGLGLERGPVFESHLEEVHRQLNADGLFVFYSDGLTETMDERMTQLGEEAVYDIVNAKRNLSAFELQQSIISAAQEFRGQAEQHDDLTLVVVKSQLCNSNFSSS